MTNHPNRLHTSSIDDRLRAASIPVTANMRILYLRANLLGLTFAGRDRVGTGHGSHYTFHIFRGITPRAFGDAGRIATVLHEDALRAFVSGWEAARFPEITEEALKYRHTLSGMGFLAKYVETLDAPDRRFQVDNDKLSVRVSLAANPSAHMLMESLVLAVQEIEQRDDADTARRRAEYAGFQVRTGTGYTAENGIGCFYLLVPGEPHERVFASADEAWRIAGDLAAKLPD